MFAALINFDFDLATLCFMLAAFAPGLGLLFGAALERRRRRQTLKAPQEEKLLRPPGHSLSLQLETHSEKVLEHSLTAMLCCGFSTIAVEPFARATLGKPNPIVLGLALAVLLLVSGAGVLFSLLAYRTMLKMRSIRLGLRGEQAAAEALHEAADAGYRVFHDVPAGEAWNIDHVAVGLRGVFLIETKAKSRKLNDPSRPAHEVTYDGSALTFPAGCGPDSRPIKQADRNAKWLADFLAKKTGEPVPVEAIVALPGWFVKYTGRGAVKVMNCKYLTKFLRSEPERLDSAQVRRIVTALDEKNRTIEFN